MEGIKFHKGTGQYYWVDLGKRIYLGTDFQKAQGRLREYLLRKQKVEENTIGGTHTPPVTLLQLARVYLDSRNKEKLDRRTRLRIVKAVSSFTDALSSPDLGPMPLGTQIRARHVKAWRSTLLDQYSQKYINHLTMEIKTMFRWLALEDLIPSEVSASVNLLKNLRRGDGGKELPPIPPATREGVEAVMPYIHEPIKTLIRLLTVTGMRPGEGAIMRPCDISTDPSRKIFLPNTRVSVSAMETPTGLVWVYLPHTHKTLKKGKPRAVLLGPKAQEILIPILEKKRPDQYLFDPKDAYKDRLNPDEATHHKPFYSGTRLARVVQLAYEKMIKQKPELSSLPRWTPYQLRHMVATETSDALGRTAAKARLGHAGYGLLDVYVEQEMQTAANAASLLG